MLKDKYIVNRGGKEILHKPHKQTGADVNPMSEVRERLEHKYHYRGEEPGLYHPNERATVKIRNTGAVEAFSDQDNGFRIDADTETINAFTNHYKAHLHHQTNWLTGTMTSWIKGHQKTKVSGETHHYSGKNIYIEGKKNLQILIDENEKVIIGGNADVEIKGNVKLRVHGNVNAKIDQHATIEVGKDLKVRSQGNIDMEARGYFRADGSAIYIGMGAR